MAMFSELNDVVHQLRYKTQIFYETLKRDSIAEQLYNFSNESTSEIDPDTPYSKSLEKDYSNLIFKGVINPNGASTPPPQIAFSPPPQKQQQQQQQPPPPAVTIAKNNIVTSPQTNSTTTSVTSTEGSTTITSTNTSTNTSTVTSTNTSTVTSTNTSTVSSPIEASSTASSAASQQPPHQPQAQQPQQQPKQTLPVPQQPPNKDHHSPKKCKIVTFSGTSVKLNKNLPGQKGNTTNNNATNNNNNSNNNSNNNNNNNNNNSKTTVTSTTTITENTNGPVFVFVKEQITKSVVSSNDSLLTKLVKPQDTEKDSFSEYGDVIPPPGIGISISVHSGVPSIGLLKFRVIEKATVIQTIVAALKTYFSNTNNTNNYNSLFADPKAYYLRIADSDGRIDEDYPTLDPNQLIYKFKDEIFILCLNPKYEPKGRSSSSSSGSSNSSSNGFNMNSNNNNLKSSTGLQPPGDAHKRTHTRQTSTNSTSSIATAGGSAGAIPDSFLVVKITLPDSSITKVAYHPEMKLRELLLNTCKKRKLYPSEHYFTLEGGSIVNLNMTMDQLGSENLILVSNIRKSIGGPGASEGTFSPTGGHNDENGSNLSDGPTDIFWYDALAWQYKTYEVVKLKKYGSKQERILGIDKERIMNNSPKEQETKRPARLIKDISKVALLDKPKNFTIEYNDGKSYIYEAKSHPLAVEIVGKISYILGK